MKIRVLVLAIILLPSPFCFSQDIQQELRFSKHLISLGNFEESKLHINATLLFRGLSNSNIDTLNYLLGISWMQGSPDSAITYFKKATRSSSLVGELAAVRSALISAEHYEDYSSALSYLKIIPRKSELKCLVKFEKAALSLLLEGKDYQPTDPMELCPNNLNLGRQYSLLNENFEYLKKVKRKSPFVAGLLSAIVPGLGRVYAGKAKQGLGSFLPVAVLGALTYEGYQNGGLQDARFIVFGSLFTLFELGNIWGSAISVKLIQQEANDQVHHQVTAAMAIPLELFLSKRD